MSQRLNIYGEPIYPCSLQNLTGWARNGYCDYDPNDNGSHLVCGRVTNDFLKFTYEKGNNLYSLGLKEGDFWCFCVGRWIEAYNYNPSIAPKLKLESTDIKVLDYISSSLLLQYRI